jgi:hypothetical protein
MTSEVVDVMRDPHGPASNEENGRGMVEGQVQGETGEGGRADEGDPGRSGLGALALGAILSGTAFAQQPTNEELRRHIQALQPSLTAIHKDL